MKRALLLSLLIVSTATFLCGCNWFIGLFNPLIGTWTCSDSLGDVASVKEKMLFNYDNTWKLTGKVKLGSGEYSGKISGSGTFTQDQAAGTVTIKGSTKSTLGDYDTDLQVTDWAGKYDYSVDGSSLTLTSSDGTDVIWTKE